MKQIYLPDFLESIAEQAEYLGQEANPEVADRFIEAVKDTTDQLKKLPYLGFTREFANSKLQSIRVWRVKGFEKYLIFYIPKRDSIEFLYLIHSARDYTRLFDDE
jgi:toxin ParE1/3/4